MPPEPVPPRRNASEAPSRPAFHDHFSPVAPGYARFRPAYPETLFEYLEATAGRRAWVWEVAAGSGQATRGLARRFHRVLATDASFHQLREASSLPVRKAVCLAEKAPLGDHSVDLVAIAQGLHWLDFDAFFREVRRVTRPGGFLAAWTYRLPVLGGALDELLRAFAYQEIGQYWPSERTHVESGYETIPVPFRERTAPSFDAVASLDVSAFLGYVSTWSAVGRARADGHTAFEDFASRWRRAWGAEKVRAVRWPVTLRMFDVI